MESVITPDQLSAAYISGVWHGAFGIGLMIFGLIGWPATRFVLSLLFRPLTRRPAQKPVDSKFWDKYQNPDWASYK